MDRTVVDLLNALPERSRYLRGLRAWTGLPSVAVPFERDPRFAGRTKYSYARLFGLAADGVVSFSRVPLRLATYIGLAAAALSVAIFVAAVAAPSLLPAPPRAGLAMLVAAALFFGAVQLVCLGIVGEYVGRIHDDVRARPLFTIRESAGIEPAPGDAGRR